MKRSTILILGGLALVAVGVMAVPAIARATHGQWGPPHGPWMMRMGPGAMPPLLDRFDTDGDGRISPAEREAGLSEIYRVHDKDGNGALSQDEFADLVAELARDFARKPFALLDSDGDGQVTLEEAMRETQRFEAGPRGWGAPR